MRHLYSKKMRLEKRRGPAPGIVIALLAVVIIVAIALWTFRSEPAVQSAITQVLPTRSPALRVEPPAPPSAATAVDIPLPRERRELRKPSSAVPVPAAPAERVELSGEEPVATALPDDRSAESRSAAPVATYSAADRGVTPPTTLRHEWFEGHRVALRSDDIITIDLVVDEQGRVESARIRNSARSVADTMLFALALQAARSWEFRPAIKEGVPVRYRQVLSFTGNGRAVPPQK